MKAKCKKFGLIDFVKSRPDKKIDKLFHKALELSYDEQERLLERSKDES